MATLHEHVWAKVHTCPMGVKQVHMYPRLSHQNLLVTYRNVFIAFDKGFDLRPTSGVSVG